MPAKNKRKKYKRKTSALSIDPNVHEMLVNMAIEDHQLIKIKLELIIKEAVKLREEKNLASQPSTG